MVLKIKYISKYDMINFLIIILQNKRLQIQISYI